MNKPLALLTIPLIFGILLSHYFPVGEIMVFFMLVLSILGLIYNIFKDRENTKLIMLVFFVLGMLITNINGRNNLAEDYGKRLECLGLVDEVLKIDEDKGRYLVILEELDGRPLKEKIILNVLGDRLDIGDKLAFNGELRLPARNGNPKLYNYRLNLMTEKIFSTMTIKEYSISEIDKSSKSFKYRLKDRFIKGVEELFDNYLGVEEGSLIKSIILGRSFYLSEEDIGMYRDLGLAHILAVSGLHIGIISGFFIFVFSRMGIKKKFNVLFTLIILWGYGYVIGFPTSILRANIMISILLYSQIIHEPYDSINSLSFACVLLLIINPYYLFNIGFQLSFIAAFAIVVFTPRIRELFYPNDNYITTSLASIIGVQFGVLPIQIYYFNKFSVLSILVNLVFIPILSIALILGFMMIIFNYCFTYINIFLGPLLNLLLSFQFKILNHLMKYPMEIKMFSPEIISIIMVYIMILLVLKIIDISKLDKSITKVMVVYLVFLLVFNLFLIIEDDRVELHFIDVGQGDALLIRTKGRDYLMDTGGSLLSSFDIGKNITLAYLEKLGVRKLDAVFISHFHEDHSQGLMALLDNIRINRVFASYSPRDNQVYKEILNRDIPYRELKAGDRLKLNKDVELLTIWPKGDELKDSENNMSLVTLLTTSNHSLLLTGDMEKEVELVLSDGFSKEIDIIKIPHHGSNTSSTEELINSIKPRVGILSLGANNMYGHPNEEIIDRYAKIGTKVYRTDEMGLIKIILKDKEYYIKEFLRH